VVFTGILADFFYILHLPLLGFGVNRVPDFLGFFFSFFWANSQLCPLDDLSEHISNRSEPVIRAGSRVSPGGYVTAAQMHEPHGPDVEVRLFCKTFAASGELSSWQMLTFFSLPVGPARC
jgi:hypothetical protein